MEGGRKKINARIAWEEGGRFPDGLSLSCDFLFLLPQRTKYGESSITPQYSPTFPPP